MGVFIRADSPYYYLWLETAPPGREREKTKIKIGTTTAQRQTSRKLAEDLYHQRMNALAAQLHQLPVQKEAITFDAFADWFDTHVVAHHRGAVREREILKVLRAAFGPRLLTEMTADAVIEWRGARATKTSPSTANRELDVLKRMLMAAVPTYRDASPLARLRRLRSPQRETYVLSPADERKLLRALTPADRALVLCALDTLMRLSDVVNLRRETVVRILSWWTRRRSRTKCPCPRASGPRSTGCQSAASISSLSAARRRTRVTFGAASRTCWNGPARRPRFPTDAPSTG